MDSYGPPLGDRGDSWRYQRLSWPSEKTPFDSEQHGSIRTRGQPSPEIWKGGEGEWWYASGWSHDLLRQVDWSIPSWCRVQSGLAHEAWSVKLTLPHLWKPNSIQKLIIFTAYTKITFLELSVVLQSKPRPEDSCQCIIHSHHGIVIKGALTLTT